MPFALKINPILFMLTFPARKTAIQLFTLLFTLLILGVNSSWAQAPTITSFTPSSGNPGTLVTITGTNMGSPTAFTIGGATAIIISNTGTSLVGMVMPGSSTGTISITKASGTATSSASFTVTATPYPSAQQGSKLVGTGAVAGARHGHTVSLSADGNTAIVGGYSDNYGAGAAWVYTRSSGTWTQQGNKLVGTGAVGAGQGYSVALSADGNTAMVGGYTDNSNAGAAWVYTRSGSTWTQQGSKLVGTGAVGASSQGTSVSLSADGNTAVVGGYLDNSNAGAAWVYTRSGSTWTQQGSKLVGTGAVGAARQGHSVSLSDDGNTVIVGGPSDNSNAGAAWVFTRSGSTWTQQGSKLVGTGATGAAYQGKSVSLSADGNTAMVGGPLDNSNAGAAWVYTRSGSTWTQQGSKLVGTGAVGTQVYQGSYVALSADGNTAIVGGDNDNSKGAVWVFTRSGSTWTQQGSKLVGTGAVGNARQGWTVSLSADGKTAIVGGESDNSNAGAAWVYVVPDTVTYNGNSHTGGAVPAVTTGANGASVTLASNSGSLTRTGYTFGGWNTLANGTGTSYAAGASYTLSGDVTLFAVWLPLPVITSFTPSSGNPGTLVTITGTDLGSPTAFTIGGATAIVISNTGTSLVGMVMPGSTTGTISITNAAGTATSSGTFTVTATSYPSVQQGSKLVGTGAVGTAIAQGTYISLSADGNTAIVGGYGDNSNAGAAWVYTRSGSTWTQQGNKLIGTGAVGTPVYQGSSVALSADGNTAIVAGNNDNSTGAVWVFTRSGSSWTQQGNKLVGTGAVGNARQGFSVSLSADGNTAIVGGFADNTNAGAAWVFTRSGSTWTQQGSKLVGTGAVGAATQGRYVSLSADGNTAMVGGDGDNSSAGAAWVFTRSGSTWTQQGSKLVGTGAVGASSQGTSVALSADGNTAMVGGFGDNGGAGAAWVYTRSGSTWTQQGSKLVGTGAVGAARQGSSVSLSADGNTAMVGARADNTNAGAAWVYTRSGGTWTQQGSKLVGTGAVGAARQGFSVPLSADGNTAMVGGNSDNNSAGAAWVYVVPDTVTYNGNSHTGGSVPTVTTGANGASVTLASNSGSLTRTGYTFGGWNTLANGTGTSYAAGASYTLSGDVTLHAQWTANSLTVTYDSQGGSAISSGITTTGGSISASPGTPTRTGYTFNGWFAASSGGSAISFPYTHGQTADFTLYAQWTANSLTVTYDSQGGSAISSGSTTTGGTVSNPGSPTRTGYTFIGWFAASSGGSAISFPYTHGQTANFTLYAQWTANSLTVTYDSQGGIAISNGSTTTGGTVSNPGSPTRTGYSFNGWFAASSGGSAISFPYTHGQTANFTLYAQWTAVCVNPTSGGIIAAAQSGVSGFNPAAFTSTAAATGQAGTLEYKWQSSTTSSSAVFSDIASSNSATYDAGVLTQTTWYKRLARVSCEADWIGAAESNVLEVTISAFASADYQTKAAATFNSATYWEYYNGNSWVQATQPPGSGNSVTILHATTMDADFTVGASKTFTITSPGTLTINSGKTLTITGNADFGGNSVTLKSSAAGTSSIGEITGSLTGATSVTVERYIPAAAKWRGLSVPLSSATAGNSIFNSWQNNGSVIAGQGVLLWSPNGETGFSLNTNAGASQNIRKYVGASGYVTLSSTDEPLFDNGKPVPYLVFVTDSYKQGTNVGNMTSGASATTLSATGTLYQGNYNSDILAMGYHMIPNPYPSAIDFTSATLTQLENKFWLWDPLLSGFSGYGGYQTYSSGVSAPSGGSYGRSYSGSNTQIPSGAAFWVYSNNTSGQISLTESAKTSGTLSVFGRVSNNNQILRVNLINPSGSLMYDGVAMANNNQSAAGIDVMDAQKFGIGAENISLFNTNKNLAIEFRPTVTDKDTFYLRLHQLKQQAYAFSISGESFDADAGRVAVLQDKYLNNETVLNLYGSQNIGFTVDNNTASSGDRFRIVFRQNTVTPVVDINGMKGVQLYPNPAVKGSELQLSFTNMLAGNYSMVVYDLVGTKLMQTQLQHAGGSSNRKVVLSSQLSSGIYIVEVSNEKGVAGKYKLTIQ